MKHAQKMVIIPEHLLQSLETERRLTTPAQLPTLTRLDQDMKQIIECPLPEDQKVFLLDQLLQRYRGLTNQMKTETTVKVGKTNHGPSQSRFFAYHRYKWEKMMYAHLKKLLQTQISIL